MTYGHRRAAKKPHDPPVTMVHVDGSFMCQAYLAALKCAKHEAGKTPTLPLAHWTRIVAEKNGWQESMIATVSAEWFARNWMTRSANNVNLLLLATEKTVRDYQDALNGNPRAAGALLTESGCLEELYRRTEPESCLVNQPIEQLVAAGLTAEEAIKMLRVLRSHTKIKEEEQPFKRVTLLEEPKRSKK